MKKVFSIAIYILIISLVIFFIIGYINFRKITNNKEPILVINETHYSINKTDEVTVYDNIIYKIVVYEEKDTKVTYNMNLWFVDDLK